MEAKLAPSSVSNGDIQAESLLLPNYEIIKYIKREREREGERVGNSKNATSWDLIYVCIEWKIRKSIWAYKLVCCCSHEKLKIDNVRETEHKEFN